MSAVALHHVQEGPAGAPVVVLLSSLGTTGAMWDAQAAGLAERLRVVRADHRGHGGSPVPPGPYALDDLGADVLALLDRLDVERAHVCGLSLGGMVAMWLAIHAPERVDRLVLLSTSAALPPDTWRERAAAVRAGGVETVADAVVGRWLTPEGAARDPALAAELRAGLVATSTEGYAGCCEAIAGMRLEDGLAAVLAPTLVVCGAQDPATPPEHAVRIAARVPGARMAVVDGAAHLVGVERPQEVLGLIRGHLVGPDAREAAGLAVRRAVLGDAHVDRAAAAATDVSAPFQDDGTRAARGEAWTRPGLGGRTRSAITLALLCALRAEDELALHVRGALRVGLTPEEIREVLLHASVYAGVPAADAAFAVAARVLAEEALPGPDGAG